MTDGRAVRIDDRTVYEPDALVHYLIVDTDRHVVIHHRRDEKDEIGARIFHDGSLSLDPPG